MEERIIKDIKEISQRVLTKFKKWYRTYGMKYLRGRVRHFLSYIKDNATEKNLLIASVILLIIIGLKLSCSIVTFNNRLSKIENTVDRYDKVMEEYEKLIQK